MAGILNQLNKLTCELGSEKPTSRQKATEQLHQLLLSCQSDIVVALQSKSSSQDFSLSHLFKSAVEATIKHAIKLEESKDAKNSQTMRNKNYLFSGVLNQIIEINSEGLCVFLSKSTILSAFVECWNMRVAVKYFGPALLNLLDRGLYKNDDVIRQLKVDDFSSILSLLYEVDVQNDEVLRFSVLKSIVKTIELSFLYSQLSETMIEYLPEVTCFASKVNSGRQAEIVIKLFHLYITKFAVDYHSVICLEVQNIIPYLCTFCTMKLTTEYKALLFDSLYIGIYAVYPFLATGDISPVGVSLNENWSLNLRKINCMIEAEIRELKSNKSIQNVNEFEKFVQLAAAAIYTRELHRLSVQNLEDRGGDAGGPSKKSKENVDFLESLMPLLNDPKSKINEIWFAIVAEVVSQYNVLNLSNFGNLFDFILNVCEVSLNDKVIRFIRKCVASLLRYEKENLEMQGSAQKWETLFKLLSSDYSTSWEMIAEKQRIYKMCIRNGKLSQSNCLKLVKIILTNNALKRTECLITVREILLHCNAMGLDKSGPEIAEILQWINEINSTININQNVLPVPADLIAETCAIAITNFHKTPQTMNEKEEVEGEAAVTDRRDPRKSLAILDGLCYKYNFKLLSIDNHLQNDSLNREGQEPGKGGSLNCLFQTNYEVLMRLTNYEATRAGTSKDIIDDLYALNKLVLLLKYFIAYKIFDKETYGQCPLVKRIGLFLSHLEMQFKSNDPKSLNFSDLSEVLNISVQLADTFTEDELLLAYLDQQPIDEMLNFLGSSVTYGHASCSNNEKDVWENITCQALQALAFFCASDFHFKDSFKCLKSLKLNLMHIKEVKLALKLIKIVASQQVVKQILAAWMVEHLKTIFKLHYTNVEIMNDIVELMPKILKYIQDYDEPLHNMLQALVSLLKVALKRSYSTALTAKILGSIETVTLSCPNIYKHESYLNICLSAIKFLYVPCLSIQYATVRLVLTLMDWRRIQKPAEDIDSHFLLCEKLYKKFELTTTATGGWDFTVADSDMLQNIKSVALQLFVGLFMFGAYQKRQAVESLISLYSDDKLHESDFSAFKEIPKHFNCSLFNLTNAYVEPMVDCWVKTTNTIYAFPYFLCCPLQNEFLRSHMPIVYPYLCMSGMKGDLTKLSSKGVQKNDVKESLPFVFAIGVIWHSKCEEAQHPDFIRHFKVLSDSLLPFGINIAQNSDFADKFKSKVIQNLVQFLQDEQHLSQWFANFYTNTSNNQNRKWFSISKASLLKCLAQLDNGQGSRNVGMNSEQVLCLSLRRNPLDFVYLLNRFKVLYSSCYFDCDRFQYLYWYYTAAALVLSSLSDDDEDDKANILYFVREVLFFILNVLQRENHWPNQLISMNFLKSSLLNWQVFHEMQVSLEVFRRYFHEILSTLSCLVETASTYADIKSLGLELIQVLVIEQKEVFSESIMNMDQFRVDELEFSQMNELIGQAKARRSESLQSICRDFMQVKKHRPEGFVALRRSLAKMKRQSPDCPNEIHDLVHYLLDTVRNSSNVAAAKEALNCLGEIGTFQNRNFVFYSSFGQTDNEVVYIK